jgi:hypothetical protein
MTDYQQILTEIIDAIEISDDFTVRHRDYLPLEVDSDSVERLYSLPPSLQAKYLTIQVQNYLHDLYFTHTLEDGVTSEKLDNKSPQIRNGNVDGIDRDFIQRLHSSNFSNGYLDADWQIVGKSAEREIVVVKDGLHLHIDRERHLSTNIATLNIGDRVSIYLPKNLIEREFYLAVGNAGLPNRQQSVQLFFNFTPNAAIAMATRLTRELNHLNIPFELAILLEPSQFDRYDGGRLCLSQAEYLEYQNILAAIYRDIRAEFSYPIPLFTKQLAPGVGIAETPLNGEDFGMNRCRILATGLVTAYLTGEEPAIAIDNQFTNLNIDLSRPYLNSPSLDPYPEWISAIF